MIQWTKSSLAKQCANLVAYGRTRKLKRVVSTEKWAVAHIRRFWSRVEKKENNCWVWPGCTDKDGYGLKEYCGKRIRCSFFSLVLIKGVKRNGLLVCHKCDNVSCVNPNHLYLGNQKRNILDAVSQGHMNKKLNKEKVLLIRENVEKLSAKVLAEKYNVAENTIRQITARERWGWLPDRGEVMPSDFTEQISPFLVKLI